MANLIVMSEGRYTVDSLSQWDKDQILQIRGLSLGFAPEIHFTNATMDNAIVRQSTVDTDGVIYADIPNSLLQKPYSIKVYICIYEDGAFKTLYSMLIPVEARNKPNDYTLDVTDDEVYSFNAVMNKAETALTIAQASEATVEGLKATVDQNNADRIHEIAVERARINQLVVLEEGSTTGDAELQDIRIGYDGTTYATAGEAVRGQIGSCKEEILKKETSQTALATNLNGLLANISENIIMSISTSQGWADMPISENCIFIHHRYGTNYAIQIVYPQRSTNAIYTRIVNQTTHTVLNDWVFDDTVRMNTSTSANISSKYGGLLANISENIRFSASVADWTDAPTDEGITFINMRYSTNYKLQIAITIASGKMFNRIVHYETKEVYRDWHSVDEDSIVKMCITQTALSNSCDKLLAKVNDNVILSCSSSQWTDMPTTAGGVFTNQRYGSNYNLQTFVEISSGKMWTRVVKRTGDVYRDWIRVDSGTSLKILALGDSICYGARNSNKGFVGDLGHDYKNVGLSSATLSNYTTSVTNIPDQLVGVTDYDPDIIIANGGVNDYYKGVSLGELSAVPVTTDTEAEALDRSTVMGGLEYLLYKMITLYPKAQRFFLITHKTYATAYSGASVRAYWPTTANQAGYTQQELHDAIVRCCELYNVKVIDVYKDSLINTLYDDYRSDVAYNDDKSKTNTEYVDSDGIHPMAYGYKEGYVPLIKQAIGIGTAK